ncbi:hypothetical protein [Psychrobacter sp. I-STPA10]|uniref:hypothetical protein n=1 Tax=Psychrobacter sp. I-STPA10 TaxID=2585769 RepID=UPI001E53C126|nr:hypothetical protein [Psychrobacter sp. I-STPA10]
MTYEHDSEIQEKLEDKEAQDKYTGFGKETMLELVELEGGKLVLRDVNAKQEPLVTIDFADKIYEILGKDAQFIGQHMIHAAVQVIMHKQMSQWHAHVYDEEPTHYS